MKFSLLIFVSMLTFSLSSHALVDMRNANFSDTWTDLIVPGSGYDLRIQRGYNSRTLFNGAFGFGWCSDFESTIEVTPEGNLNLTECGGGLELTYYQKGFNPKSIDKTIATIIASLKKKNKKNLKPSYYKDLKKKLKTDVFLREEFARQLKIKGKPRSGKVYIADGREAESIHLKGGMYTRTLPDGTYQKFDEKGRMAFMYDKNNNYIKINYKKGQINTITDNSGRQLSFKYDPKSGKVAKVIAPNGLSASYTYKGEDLVAATNAWNNTYTYKYDDLHNLIEMGYPDKTTRKVKYDKNRDWVTGYENRKGCTETYNYDFDKKDPMNHYWSTVKKVCKGKVTNNSRYEFWHKMRGDGTGRYLSRMRSKVNGETTDIRYHDVFGKPISIFKGRIKVAYKYYDSGLVKSKIESDRVTGFAYNKTCNKVEKVITKFYRLELPKAEENNKKNKKREVAKNVSPKKVLFKTLETKFKYSKKKCNLIYAENSDGQTVQLSYDSRGRISKIKDQAKKLVTIKYEERFGKPAIVTRPGLGSIRVKYKKSGDIEKVESDEGASVAIQVASIFNNLLDIISPATSELSL